MSTSGLRGSGQRCDTHMHFYDDAFEAAPEAMLFPPNATPHDYHDVQAALGLDRVVVVQPTTYGLDNRCQLAALATYGDQARGVMVVNALTSDAELGRLSELGVRGARFHMLPGGAVPWSELEPVAANVAKYGWHIQLQCNGRELAARYEQLAGLPTEIVIDHVGRFMPPAGVADKNFGALLSLVENERAWVKLSAPYESSLEPITNEGRVGTNHSDVLPLVDHLVSLVPERLLWATNWPHPGQDPAPTEAVLAAQMQRWLPTDELVEQVLVANPARLYFSD